MKMCNFQATLNDFAKLVDQKLYKKINYQNWRALVKMGDKCEIYYNRPNIKLFSGDTNDDSMLVFSINDESFGTYLYSRYFASNANEDDSIYTKVDSYITTSYTVPIKIGNYPTSDYDPPVNDNNAKKEKENKNMFNKFNFGPVTDGSVRFSPYGMSICNIDGKWVSYNARQNQIIETEGFTFEMDNMIYKIPVAVKDVRPGDMIIHNDTYVYVLSNENGNIKVVNIFAGDQRTILPPSNMFGFNFVTKVVSMLDMAGLGCGTPTADQPFGNILPMLVMSQMFDNKGKSNDFGQIMMMSMMCNGQNPFMNMFAGNFNQTSCGCATSGTTLPPANNPAI